MPIVRHFRSPSRELSYFEKKKKHRDVRVGIVLRRRLGREPDELELGNAVNDGDDYKDLSRNEIIHAYEQGYEVRRPSGLGFFRCLMLSVFCCLDDVCVPPGLRRI